MVNGKSLSSNTKYPLPAHDLTLLVVIVVWVRTQCDIEVLAIHTIEMIPKSMILEVYKLENFDQFKIIKTENVFTYSFNNTNNN